MMILKIENKTIVYLYKKFRERLKDLQRKRDFLYKFLPNILFFYKAANTRFMARINESYRLFESSENENNRRAEKGTRGDFAKI